MTSPIKEPREALAKLPDEGNWNRVDTPDYAEIYTDERVTCKLAASPVALVAHQDNANFIVAARNHLPALLAEYDRMEKENTSLRRIAAKVMPCHYCGVEDIGMCPSGFPGCALADDMMMGDEDQLAAVRAELAQAKAAARRDALIEAADFVAQRRDGKGNLAAFAITANHLRKMAEGEPT